MPVVSNNDPSALLSGDYWGGIEVTGQPVIVTYSFATSAPAYDSSVPGFNANGDTAATFQAFTPAEQAQAIQALNAWSSVSGIVFVQVDAGQGDINFQNVDLSTTTYTEAGGIGFYPFGVWDYASYPNFTADLSASGDVFMNTQFQAADGSVEYGTLLHEIGHAIGLKHPTEDVVDGVAQPAPVDHDQVLASDDPSLTIMAESGDDGTLQALDKAAAAEIYGPAGTGGVYTDSASGSNSVSQWSWDATSETLTQTAVDTTATSGTTGETIIGTSVNDVITGSAGDDRLFGLDGSNTLIGGDGNDSLYGGPDTNTLIGGAGDDTYYVSSTATTIVENPGEGDDAVISTVSFTLPDNVEQLQVSGEGLTATGNDQGDRIYGDGTFGTTLIGGTGDDYMVGGSGNDTLEGGGGRDIMYGQDGADTFVFKATGDAPLDDNPFARTAIGDFSVGQDKIDLSAITTADNQPLSFIGETAFTNQAGEVHQVVSDGNSVIEGDVDGDGTADFQIELYGTTQALQASDFEFSNTVCYCAGTLILTEHGEVPVERLATGDRVVTAAGAHRPIRWIGHRTVDLRGHPNPAAVQPIRIAAHAFGENKPSRDLFVSPRHAIGVTCMQEVLIPASALVNGATVVQVSQDKARYWHVELDSHDVILANGLPAESYVECGNRAWFSGGEGSVDTLLPAEALAERYCRPLVESGPMLEFCRARLDEQAEALGWRSSHDMQMFILADGRRIEPMVDGNLACFLLPQGAGEVRLISETFVPKWRKGSDGRQLGICISGLRLIDGFGWSRNVALDDPALDDSFHPQEASRGAGWRWTGGDCRLPRQLWADARGQLFLRVLFGETASSRWLPPESTATMREPAADAAKVVPFKVA